MTSDEPGDYAIGIRIDDPQLAMRIAGLLAQAPGLRIAAAGERAELILSAATPNDDGDFAPLTPREYDVLALLAEGLSNRAIGARLGIAPDTAKFHVGRLRDKLDATGRTDAVAHAVRRGIIRL